MKKIIALGLCVLTLALSFVACGKKKTTCDLCGKENVDCSEIKVDGESGWFCDDCYEAAEALAKAAEAMK